MVRKSTRFRDASGGFELSNGSGGQGVGSSPNSSARDRMRAHNFGSMTTVEEKAGVTWRSVNAFANTPIARRHILKNVSGCAIPGSLLAVMGSSGAGKSTIMNIITHRTATNIAYTGEVLVNGRDIGMNIKRISAYIPQEDVFLGYLTVREHLWFHAKMRMGDEYTNDDMNRRISRVMLELNLAKCADALIGTPGVRKSLSGGEMKRLSFASEVSGDPSLEWTDPRWTGRITSSAIMTLSILSNPHILFCDEPTTGLDSFMAETVIQSLKTMTSKGKTVVCTIHQPSSQVYQMFDRVMFMSDGHAAMIGSVDECTKFFASHGYECPLDYNPADYLVQVLAIKPNEEQQSKRLVEDIVDKFNASEYADEVKTQIDLVNRDRSTTAFESLINQEVFKANWPAQALMLLWRAWLEYYRTPQFVTIRFAQCVFYGIFYGLLYLTFHIDQLTVFNLNGLFFEIIALMLWENIYAVVHIIPTETPVLRKDYDTGIYSFSAYFVTRTSIELPFLILNTVTEASPIYFMAYMYQSGAPSLVFGTFMRFLIVLNMVAVCATSMGYLLTSVSNNIGLLVTVILGTIFPISYVSGFYINISSIPPWLKWFQYISFYFYANEALVVNQWQHVEFIECPSNNTLNCYNNGTDVINFYSYIPANFWIDVVAMIAISIALRFIAYFILVFKLKRRMV